MQGMKGKKKSEVAKEIIKRYGQTHYIPGIEYWKYILNNPDKAPQSLKDGNWHYFFGSILRLSNGRWSVPCVFWDGSVFNRYASWLVIEWISLSRVVLVEK